MTDWEQHYREGQTPWDKGEPSPGLVDFLENEPLAGAVLVPGCGFGHDVRAIAARGDAVEVVGLDVAPSAVAEAQRRCRWPAERYELANLFDLPAQLRNRFDWVWEHTCFCAIDPSQRVEYVEAVAGALKPGGQFLAVFYLNPYDEEHREGGPPFGVSVEEIERQFQPFFVWEKSWVPVRTYPERAGREWMAKMRKRGPLSE